MITKLWPLALLILCSSCKPKVGEATFDRLEGDAEPGKTLLTQHGCVACHTIPGIRTAGALSGPNLDHFASRNFVGGGAENTPGNVVAWIRNPQAVKPGSGMPNLHIREPEARDMEAYLRELR